MKRVLLIFLGILAIHQVFSQDTDENESKKDRIIDAEYLYLNEEYINALQKFRQLVNEDPDNANLNYRTGLCYLKLPFENGRSIPYLQKAAKNITRKYKEGSYKETKAPIDALYWLGYALHTNKYYDKALQVYQTYRDTLLVSDVYNIRMVERQMESCKNAKELTKTPVDVEISNLGNVVNSVKGDINPCVSADGKTIIYTRVTDAKVDSVNMNKITDKKFTILESHLDSTERWSIPVNLNGQLGTHNTCKSLSLSADGNELLLFNDDWSEGGPTKIKQGSIYYSKRVNGKWTGITTLSSNINSFSWESHASISPDGSEIYFTSDRNGGYGGLDIYVSKLKNGNWGPAENLGPTINTPHDEETPAILPDGKTLYFSSEGHYSMGGFDVFYSTKLDSGKWSEPINVGYPINSPDDNLFYVPIQDGSRAFYSVARHEGYITFGNEDIYELDIVNDPSKFPSIAVSGKVTFEDMNDLDTSVKIVATDTLSKKTTADIKPDLSSGQYNMALRPGEYEIKFKANNYKEETRYISLPRIRRPTPVVMNVGLIPTSIKEEKYYEIRNVYFDYNKYDLNREAMINIEKLFVVMNENPGLYIEVIGHCDSRGSDQYNKKLSIERSRSVIDYLVKKGIEEKRFVSKGEGKNALVAKDKNKDGSLNPEGARLNRRVELRVLKSDNNMVVSIDEFVPENLRFAQYNRFSIIIKEDKELLPLSVFDPLKSEVKEVSVLPTQKGYLYYGGDFRDQAMAAKTLNKVVAKGYTEASIADYFYLNKLNRFLVTNRVDWPRKYTIQLKAVDSHIIIDAKGIQDVKEIKTADGFYRYTYKEFTDLNDAQAELKKVIEKGFTNAFIIEVSKLK